MNPRLSLGVVAALALSACGGSHGSTTVPATKATAAKTHVRHLQSDIKATYSAKRPSTIIGGPPLAFNLSVQLFDAPLIGANAANSQFNAGILGIDAIDANGDSWQLIGNTAPDVVNLLSLQTASFAVGNGELPAGTYPSVQMLLDPATTTVTYNGQTYPVEFVDPNHPWWDPTQTIEAVSVPLSVTGTQGDTIGATLDFNVFQSANLDNGIVYLTPTVAGGIGSPSISGTVANDANAPVSNATVVATDANGNVANTAVTAADGSFHLRAISAGSYTVKVLNSFTTNAGVTVTASGNDSGRAPSAYVVVGPNSEESLGTLRD